MVMNFLRISIDMNYRHCPKCKGPKDSSKKIEIWNVPNILIIHLKRFKFTRTKRGKIRSVVDFPVTDLDLSSYLEQPQRDKPIYALFAVSVNYSSLYVMILYLLSVMKELWQEDTTLLTSKIEILVLGISLMTAMSKIWTLKTLT